MKMRKIENKLYADYVSDHIMMTYPWMHQKHYYYSDLVMMYRNLSKIFDKNNIRQTLILPEIAEYDHELISLLKPNVETINYSCDDIWIRDYYPKLYFDGKYKKAIYYNYNGYGKQYSYSKDNNLKKIASMHLLGIDLKDLVLEGGNLEFSSKGVLIANKRCLVKNNTNFHCDKIIKKINLLKNEINISETYIINIDSILGDDTNGHIDNLVRFIDDETLVYFASKDKSYPNYKLACELKKQVNNILETSHIIKKILPINHTSDDIFIKNKKIYPYSKLNFIATKNCYIFPSIGANEDTLKNDLDQLNLGRKFYIINSEASLVENGGLHCLTTNI